METPETGEDPQEGANPEGIEDPQEKANPEEVEDPHKGANPEEVGGPPGQPAGLGAGQAGQAPPNAKPKVNDLGKFSGRREDAPSAVVMYFASECIGVVATYSIS